MILENARGWGGKISIASIGTLAINIDDENGWIHLVQIPKSIYMPNLPTTLICPQHCAQQDMTSHPWSPEGIVCYMMAKAMVLKWDQCKFYKTIRQSQAMNTPTFFTSPDANLYEISACSLKHFGCKSLPKRLYSRWWVHKTSSTRMRQTQNASWWKIC